MKKLLLCKIAKAAGVFLLGGLLFLPVSSPLEIPGEGIATLEPASEEDGEEGIAPCGDFEKEHGDGQKKES